MLSFKKLLMFYLSSRQMENYCLGLMLVISLTGEMQSRCQRAGLIKVKILSGYSYKLQPVAASHHLNCLGLRFRAASSATSLIRFCRVSGRLAKITHCRIIFLTDLLSAAKNFFEPGFFLNAAARSLGI